VRDAASHIHLDDPPKQGIAFSAGLTALRGDAQSMDDPVNEADTALYAAKHAGRGGDRIRDMHMQIKADAAGTPPARRSSDALPAQADEHERADT